MSDKRKSSSGFISSASRPAARVRRRGGPGRTSFEACESRLLFSAAPTATFNAIAAVTTAAPFVDFTVTYDDDVSIDPATLGVGDPADPGYPTSPADLVVAGPNGFTSLASYLAPDIAPAPGPTITATYRMPAPSGRFTASATGTYTVSAQPSAVQDGEGNSVPQGDVGSFAVSVPAVTGGNLSAGLDTDLAIRALAVQPNGKIVIVGDEQYARFGSVDEGEDANQVFLHTRGVIRRYNADGTIDTAFGGGDGRVEAPSTGDSTAGAVVVRSDGTIYVAGGSGVAGLGGGDFILTRYTAAGAVDSTFGTGGQVTVDFDPGINGPDFADAIAFQSTGKIVLGGQATTFPVDTPVVSFGLVRLNANGSIDTSFGNSGDGLIVTDLSSAGTGGVGRLIVGPSDEVIVAGGSGSNGVGVARFTADGDPDPAFDGDGEAVVAGLVTPGAGSTADPNVGLARLSDGSLLISAATATGQGIALARLRAADGSRDTGFGSAGLATASFGGADDADGVLVLPSGNYLDLGTDKASNGDIATAAAAFNSNGAPATAFGTNGKALFDPAPAAAEEAPSVAAVLDSAGMVVLARVTGTGSSRLRRFAGDFNPPAAALSTVADVTTAGGTSVTLTVTYSDDVAVNAADITANGGSTITVTGPGGPIAAALSSVDSMINGKVRVATYTMAAPGGSFDAADNGVYTVAVAASKVRDTAGNAVPAGTLGTFHVSVPPPGAPTAALTPVAAVTTAGGTSLNFTVTYTDPDSAIDTTTIGPSDVTVAAAGGAALQVSGASRSGSGSNIVVTYTVVPPGSSWDPADNGDYVISVVAGEVKDTTGLAVPAATLGSFNVNVVIPDDTGMSLGDFGIVDGKRQPLAFTDSQQTMVTLSLKNGTGHAVMKDGRVFLTLTGTGPATVVSVKTKGGSGRTVLGDVTSDGAIRMFNAPAADLAGALSVNGSAGKVTLGSVTGAVTAAGPVMSLDVRGAFAGAVTAGGAVSKLIVRGDLTASVSAGGLPSVDVRGNLAGVITTTAPVGKIIVRGATPGQVSATGGIARLDLRGPTSGTIAAAGPISLLSVRGEWSGTVAASSIKSLTIRGNVSGATVLAGANFGTDGLPNGAGLAADSYASGAISKIVVTGTVIDSRFGAGLDPVNGLFGDGDDRVVGGSASAIGAVTVKGGVAGNTHFIAGAFGRIRAPGLLSPAAGTAFEVL